MRTDIGLAGLLLAMGILTACSVWPEHKPQKWTDVTGGESLERAFWNDLKAKNWKDLEPHIASNYVLVTPEGTFNHAEALERWKRLDLQEYSLGDFNIQLSGNAYIVSYSVMMRGTLAGKPLPTTPVRAMSVWQQYARDWVTLAHSATPSAGNPQNTAK
jgi:hypothetical protein